MTSSAQKTPRRGRTSDAVIYALGNVIRQLVGFVMLPIYTTFLTAADYGVLGLLAFSLSLIDLAFGARLVQAVPKFYYAKKSNLERNRVISTALTITAAISTITMTCVIGLRDQASGLLFNDDTLSLVIGLFAVQILTTAVENYALLYVRIQKRPWLFISLNVAKLAVQLGLNIWFVVILEYGVLGIAISAAASSAAFAIALGGYTLMRVGIGFSWGDAKDQVRYCWPLWLAGFAALYTGSSNRYYMNIFVTLEDIGLYELAAKFSTILTALVWTPFMQYWQTERFEIYGRQDSTVIYQQVFQIISFILVAAALGISIFAPTVIELVANPDFWDASSAIPYLAFGSLFMCLGQYMNFSFLALGATHWINRNNYLVAVIATVAYVALIPGLGYIGAAIAIMVTRLVQLVIIYRASLRFFDMQLKIGRPILIVIAASLCLVLLDYIPSLGHYWNLLARTAVFILTCTLMMLILLSDRKNAIAVKAFLSRRSRKI